MKSSRIYYRPGMISLIGLPLLVWMFLLPHHSEQSWIYPRPLRLFIPSDGKSTRNIRIFSTYNFLSDIRGKKVLEINFNETWSPYCDSLSRSEKKDFIVRKVEDLQFLHDTTTVLKVDFGDKNTYGDFIWLLALAHKYMMKHYAFFGDAFYLLGNPRQVPIPDTQKLPGSPTMGPASRSSSDCRASIFLTHCILIESIALLFRFIWRRVLSNRTLLKGKILTYRLLPTHCK
jgi:hypothetical protein